MPSLIGFNLFDHPRTLSSEVTVAYAGDWEAMTANEVFPFAEIPRKSFDKNHFVLLTNKPLYTYTDFANTDFLLDPADQRNHALAFWCDINRSIRLMGGQSHNSSSFKPNIDTVLRRSGQLYKGPFIWRGRTNLVTWRGMVFSNDYLLNEDTLIRLANAYRSVNRILHTNKNRYVMHHNNSSAGFVSLDTSRILYGIKTILQALKLYVDRRSGSQYRFLCTNSGTTSVTTNPPTLRVYSDISQIIDAHRSALRIVYSRANNRLDNTKLKDFVSRAIPVLRSMSSRDMSDECFERIIKGNVARV